MTLNTALRQDPAVSPVQQCLQPIDLVLFVDVDFERQVRPVPSGRPREGSDAVEPRDGGAVRAVPIDRRGGRAGCEGVVEEPGEEESGDDDEEGADLVRASAGSVVVVVEVVRRTKSSRLVHRR